jgi:hypothetical protein
MPRAALGRSLGAVRFDTDQPSARTNAKIVEASGTRAIDEYLRAIPHAEPGKCVAPGQ